MTKRNLVTLMLACVAALTLSANARAGQAFAGADGCAVLAELIYTEVTAAAWSISAIGARHAGEATRADVSICNRTVQTVTKAFTLAMSSVGVPVRWGAASISPGDTCMSHYLDQCYPNRSRLDRSEATWMAVLDIVSRAMPYGAVTDQSVFDSSTMQWALRAALNERSVETITPMPRRAMR